MEKFNVLPTDPRYTDLTSEQIAFMVTQMELDEKARNKHLHDDEDGDENEDPYNTSEQEVFEDPDFDEVWNNLDDETWEEVD